MAVFPTLDAHAHWHGAWAERQVVTYKACFPSGGACTLIPWQDTHIVWGGNLDFSFSSSSFERAFGDRELFPRSACELGSSKNKRDSEILFVLLRKPHFAGHLRRQRDVPSDIPSPYGRLHAFPAPLHFFFLRETRSFIVLREKRENCEVTHKGYELILIT